MSVDLIAFLGIAIIVLNILFALLNIKNLRYLAYQLSPIQRIR